MFKLMRVLIVMVFALFLYFVVDKRIKITDKVRLNLTIKSEWQATYVVANMLLLMLLLETLSKYFIYVSEFSCDFFNGFIIGISLGLCINLSEEDESSS
ncbi:hypothetical protein [Clostridium sp. DL1XJH146]